ncbi:hypothetical protein PInf_001736 [Phytophthora infestans]|nr:hypothetical protein PInf_001736 [Phytophthora infestans]
MLRVVSRLAQPSKRVTQLAAKSFVGSAASHDLQCRYGSCVGNRPRYFSVQSQTRYDIPKTQTAIMYESEGAPLQIRTDWPVVQPKDLKPGEILVRMAYSGVCHSDVIIWEGGGAPVGKKMPLVGGHEGTGYVAAIAENTTTNLKVGDPVGVKWLAHSCLGCEDCRKGHETTCESVIMHGYTIDGSFQQWCVSYADHVTPIPKGYDMAAAAPLLCAGVTVYSALKEIGGASGEYVVIPGAGGGLGHLACQYARSMGYKVIAIDSGDDKRKLLEGYGVKHFIDFKDGDVVGQVKAITGRGAHCACVVADTESSCQDALQYIRRHGTVLMVGVPKGGLLPVPIEPTVAFTHRIIGTNVGNRQDSIETVNLAADGAVETFYNVEPLTNLPDVFKRMKAGYDIPKTQTAVMYEADNSPLQVREDWPVAQPEDLKAGEVLVRIAYTGVCHSDLSVWEGGGPPLPKQFPMIGGHEGTGYVAAIGANTKTKLKVGDAVGVKWLAHTCLGCEDCRKGYETTCGEAGVHGLTCHGTFQQWCVSFADHVTPIPKTLDLASAAPILCAGMTVYKALKQIGGSPVRACYMGYKVVAIDSGDDKPKLIESYGIKSIIDFKDRDVIDQVRAATGGRGAHAVIVVAGSKDAYKDPLMFLRPRGTLVAVGVPKDTAVVAPVEPLIPLEFRIVGSYVGSRQDAIEAIDLAADGHVKSSYTVEPLKNLPDVFKRMHAVKLRGRVVLDCE